MPTPGAAHSNHKKTGKKLWRPLPGINIDADVSSIGAETTTHNIIDSTFCHRTQGFNSGEKKLPMAAAGRVSLLRRKTALGPRLYAPVF